MKWNEPEINYATTLLLSGKTYSEIASVFGITRQAVRLKLNRLNIFSYKESKRIKQLCESCEKEFLCWEHEKRKYCSHSCSAKETNKLRRKPEAILEIKTNGLVKKLNVERNKNCLNCHTELVYNNKSRKQKKYCSPKCNIEFKKNEKFGEIENGNLNMNSWQYKKYLIEKFGEKCMECDWSERHPLTGKVPIELEHIDGNSENNKLENLKLLCPNCHSLTPTYKGLNMGNGRHKRRERYRNGQSF